MPLSYNMVFQGEGSLKFFCTWMLSLFYLYSGKKLSFFPNSILFVFISHIIQKTFAMIIKFVNMLSMRDVDAIKNA